MLLQFTVENFLSFDEATTFSMRAGKDKDHSSHLVQLGKETAVQGAAIYGANAAGKSNLILAMGFARDLIVGKNSAKLNDLRPFRLNAKERRSSGFHWQFVHGNRLWSYGFDLTPTTVEQEYLFARELSSGREKRWFERTTSEDGETKVKLGAEFVEAITKDDAQLLKLKAPRLDEDSLFLREILAEKIDAVAPVFEWFDDVLLIVRAETSYDPLLWEARENKEFLDFLSTQLRNAATGIHHLFPLAAVTKDKEVAQSMAGGHAVDTLVQGEYVPLNGSNPWTLIGKVEGEDYEMIGLYACFEAGEQMLSTLAAESEGTQRFIHLLPHFYRLQTRPTVLIIDEFERRLHTLLTQRLLKSAFDSPQPNNQFIFTTHDTNLLDSALLRRDEVWFVDKNKRGASCLVSLVEFKIRSDANYEKGYLLGAFDGIPYFRSDTSTPMLVEAE